MTGPNGKFRVLLNQFLKFPLIPRGNIANLFPICNKSKSCLVSLTKTRTNKNNKTIILKILKFKNHSFFLEEWYWLLKFLCFHIVSKLCIFKFNIIYSRYSWKYEYNHIRFKANICKDAHIYNFPMEPISSEFLYFLTESPIELLFFFFFFADDLLGQNLQRTKEGHFFSKSWAT